MLKTWPTQGGKRGRTVEERFWEKVEKTDTCWLWRGAKSGSGYGGITIDHKLVRVHVLSLSWTGVDIPKGAFVCHKCDVRLCVNPDHLYVGDFTTNNRDSAKRSPSYRVRRPGTGAAISAGLRKAYADDPMKHPLRRRTHCKYGHLYDEANTYWYAAGYRGCRACAREKEERKRRAAGVKPRW